MAESRFSTLSTVLLVTGAVGVGACGTGTPSAATDAAVRTDASLFATDATDAAVNMDAPESVACAIPQDCIDFSVGPAVSCCINKACIYGQAAIDAVPCTDADVQLILASNYDQSCQTDSDCVAAGEGNFCIAGEGNCPSAAINKSAYSQYQADVAKTNASICRGVSSCGAESGPCCRRGLCEMGIECSDSSDASSDAVSEQCPPGVACDCTYVDGAYYNCGIDGGVPACPDIPATSCGPVGALCASCPEGAGIECSCLVTDAGAQWLCVGTEYPCGAARQWSSRRGRGCRGWRR